MVTEDLIRNMTALQLLEILRSQINTDHPTGILAEAMIKSVAADIILLNEIHFAALTLADRIINHTGEFPLPTADSQIIKTIRIHQTNAIVKRDGP